MSTRLSRSLSAGAWESPVYQGKRGQRLSTHASFFSYSYLLVCPVTVPTSYLQYGELQYTCSGTSYILIISIIRYLPAFYESCRVHRLIIFESLCRRAYPNFASLFHTLFICLFTRLVPS